MAQGRMGLVTGLLIGTDVTIVEPELSSLDAGERFAQINVPGANRFNFRSEKLDPGFVGVQNLIITLGLTIRGDVLHNSGRIYRVNEKEESVRKCEKNSISCHKSRR